MKKLGILLYVPAIVLAHNVSSNIGIVPLDAMPIPEYIKHEFQANIDEIKNKGYVERDNPYVRQLLLMQGKPAALARATQPHSDELRGAATEVKTIFKFNPVLPNPKAYMGIGMMTDDGWSGIKEFFDGGDIGMCSLSVYSLSDGEQVRLNQESVTYGVNDKPTKLSIKGHIKTGFMYTVLWYDKNYIREIHCANLKYDKTITDKIIALARTVDNN